MTESVYERVKKRAYELWEEEGRPWGRDMIHWERAHQEIAAGNEAAPPIRVASVETADIVASEAGPPAKGPAKRASRKAG